MKYSSNVVTGVLATLVVSMSWLQTAAGASCEADKPARPVPQFTAESTASLWPIDPVTGEFKLKPAAVQDGATRVTLEALPPERDSTDYETKSAPGYQSGHELFQDVAIPGSRVQDSIDELFMVAAYNAGISVWDIGTDPARPDRKIWRDGWQGHWAVFPHFGEKDTFVYGVDAVRVGSSLFIGVAAQAQVGFSIWIYDTQTGNLKQKYQDLNSTATDVSVATDPNGDTYAYVADAGGIRVYNMSASLIYTTPCVVANGTTPSCGIYKGKVGAIGNSVYVSAWVANNETYIAASDGRDGQNPLHLEIWEVGNPNDPDTAPFGGSIRRFQGFSDMVHTPQLFTYDGKHYLALIETLNFPGSAFSFNDYEMRIYDVSLCLSGSNCTPVLRASDRVKNSFAGAHFLDVSFSGGDPFLHYGMQTTGLRGSEFERLWELASLPNALSPLPEVTDGGGTYVDSCGNVVDYFGDYYIKNDWGLKWFNPRHAVFNGDYLYRAGTSVLDVHVRGGSQQTSDPTIVPRLQDGTGTIDATTFWIDDAVMLDTTVNNCLASATGWCWDADGDNANVDIFPLSGCNAAFSKSHELTFECGLGSRCADTSVSVAAWNTNCDGTEVDQNSVAFNLKDPAVELTPLDFPTSYPVCSTVPLDATVNGRGAATWSWTADGEPIAGCSGSIPAGADLGDASFGCNWDTSGLKFEEVFLDGFESGCGRWSTGCPAESMLLGFGATKQTHARRGSLAVKSGGIVNAELVIKNGSGVVVDSASESIDFYGDGDPIFDGALATPVVNGSGAALRAPATGTTLWTWELEDPDAGTAACSFNGSKQCVVEETTSDTLEYVWQTGAATYTYKVSISNCVSGLAASAVGTVAVQAAVLPEILDFAVSNSKLQGTGDGTCFYDVFGNCGASGTVYCPKGVPIEFDVVMAEADDSFSFSFDWERASTGETADLSGQSPNSVAGTTYVFDRTFSSGAPSTIFPTAKVQFGNEMVLTQPLVLGTCP